MVQQQQQQQQRRGTRRTPMCELLLNNALEYEEYIIKCKKMPFDAVRPQRKGRKDLHLCGHM